MGTFLHFLNVGQGNMALIQTSDNQNIVVDCNITDANECDVFTYLSRQVGELINIDVFICSHRDADHMRGIKKLHAKFPIRAIFDNEYPGTSTDTKEYRQYMEVRREIGNGEIKKMTWRDFGRTRLRYLSACDDKLANNANAQGIVIKVEHLGESRSNALGSVMLTGDSDAETWRYGIQKDYSKSELDCDILVAGHHGSITFFDDPANKKLYYVGHIVAMNPAMTIVSVGKNPHGHPNTKAMNLYEEYSSGSDEGNKILRTDEQGNICVHLKDEGGWIIKIRQ